ncbi:hypothetical protein NDU88_001377 [Pleurodeles waltl]|uniref:Uncharacterized protein n=1 Tax=Pleurodeles waltl TaxID=8319 RepID=A0AAV7MMH7_PLEWA|nr:hypothetical protein NDU88_001377 [Pleurodeles waltl]
MHVSTGSGGGLVPRVHHAPRDGPICIGAPAAHGLAVLELAVPCSAVLKLAVPCSAVPELEVPCSAVPELAVPCSAVPELAVLHCPAGLWLAGPSWAAGLWLAGPSWAAGLWLAGPPLQLGCGWWGPPGQLGCGWWGPPGQRGWGWRWPPVLRGWGWRWPPGQLGCGWRGLPGQRGWGWRWTAGLWLAGPSWAVRMGLAVTSWAAGLWLAGPSRAARMGLAGPSWAAGMMAVFSAVLLLSDLPGFLWPFPTLGGVTAESTLPPGPLGAAWVAGVFPLSRRALANFWCFTGGGLAVLWLCATLAVLVAGALHIPVTTGTTGPGDVVVEVQVRDL